MYKIDRRPGNIRHRFISISSIKGKMYVTYYFHVVYHICLEEVENHIAV